MINFYKVIMGSMILSGSGAALIIASMLACPFLNCDVELLQTLTTAGLITVSTGITGLIGCVLYDECCINKSESTYTNLSEPYTAPDPFAASSAITCDTSVVVQSLNPTSEVGSVNTNTGKSLSLNKII